ncbi:hypothetical protein IMG5_145150 [Ichthyophthirius multifiliis]|uniref:ATP-dependent (S)-NAD(P)H-hydrate dehydratase n=1 Tax=Ichthyophthirius multifiliis TaxID=5932 RepID=G0QXT5_ICHMU|nr:hypothetical protein IMG5_145150 [Ichthyophthirius multifiliis]EGR29966.1 hypothetical protein IMG5_145150 [Ichthyophthirius multifiliis]|eukprot:XP_004031202.1 hypothetical protein IMG5_145150 [Ichthyophthirius multifiliis]
MKSILPKILNNFHKEQNGCLAIIGGCLEYSGSPYYSALSQLKGGADQAHIFCTKQAAIPIKSYSPEIITHPYLHALNEQEETDIFYQKKLKETVNKITQHQENLDSFVIGPGLGRDQWISEYLGEIIENIKKQQIIVLDADGIWYLIQEYNKFGLESKIFKTVVQKDSQYHILTPNQVEFQRLWKCFVNSNCLEIENKQRNQLMEDYVQGYNYFNKKILDYVQIYDFENPIVKDAVILAQKLNNINIIHKGIIDVVTNGKEAYLTLQKSSHKRCGGIGDILSGLVGVYCCWAQKQAKKQPHLNEENMIILGCIFSSCLTRKASSYAYQKYNISLTAPNIIEFIGKCFTESYNLYQKEDQNQ